MNVPKLIVVTGRPGSGKTTLAHALARSTRCPVQPLQDIAQIRLIVCSIDPMLVRTRFIQRNVSDPERESYHGSGVIRPDSAYELPQLAVPVLTVDTSDGYKPSLERIKEFVVG